MSDFKKDQADCDHENLEYHGMDVGEPGVIYENRTCRECGADVDLVYKPSHELVHLPEENEMYEREV